MRKGARKFRVNASMQGRFGVFLQSLGSSRLFVKEQSQLGNEADIRDGNTFADQELAVGRQRLVDSTEVDHKAVTHPRVTLRRYRSTDQRKQINLRVARK